MLYIRLYYISCIYINMCVCIILKYWMDCYRNYNPKITEIKLILVVLQLIMVLNLMSKNVVSKIFRT